MQLESQHSIVPATLTFAQSAAMSSDRLEGDAIEILNYITVHANTPVSVFSKAGPLSITYGRYTPSLVMHAHIPTIVQSAGPMKIALQAPLGDAFVRGWNKLPTELKLAVVERLGNHFDVNDTGLHMSATITVSNFSDTAWPTLLSCLRMTPEIAALSLQVFYNVNKFFIFPLEEWPADYPLRNIREAWEDHRMCRIAILLPPRLVRHFIHRLDIKVRLDTHGADILQKIADGSYGFTKLTYLTVWLSCSRLRTGWRDEDGLYCEAQGFSVGWERLAKKMLGDGIEFECQGMVVLKGLHHNQRTPEDVDALKKLARKMIRFGVKKEISAKAPAGIPISSTI
ncbi:hypothetical protein BDV95DRAFT_615690 [Massariosphaeria phaeospora]|uniref:Uncharacterized protein n=1 Tax=Massariosphaeria phaeospora TaxID=100035 RepID=A0A7C8MKL2_9PLEO|nr:hypothetical protein BDV95DRAFT_615690 [Massariosphaeria phaeospora]